MAGALLLDGLNAQQREAVLATEGPVLILAGAGSGKTRVITHRIAHLVTEQGVPGDAILAVTFTNKAAGEMKARAEALVGGPWGGWISTFHSLCVRLLRRDGPALGLPRDFVIYDDDDQMSVVREALRALDLSERLHPPRRLLARISAAKNAATNRDDDGSVASEVVASVTERYRRSLETAHALDFDDLLLKTVELLETDAAVRERYRRQFRYLLVDEYQDTNPVQYALVKQLAGSQGNVTVVGDEDQSIYSWRGASIRNILDFERDFPGARVLRLEENYRSTQAILDAASAVVSHNRQRKGKTLRAVSVGGRPVRLHEAYDEFEEAAWVVGGIAPVAGTGGRAAVLYRMNSQSRLFEEALRRSGIPYTIVGGVGFYERKEVKDALAYLKLVVNPSDSVALRRILNVPPRGIGARTVTELESTANRRGQSLWSALSFVVDEGVFPARATVPLQQFRGMIEALRREAEGAAPRGFLERVLEVTGYAAVLAGEDTAEAQDRLANLAELLSAAAEYQGRVEEPTLSGFLDQMSLVSDVDKTRGDAPVLLMTLHSAKGLEFDAVFLAGVEEGLLPHSRSVMSDDGVEEERRLCYVGMTRARQRLHLSWARSRMVFGQRRTAERSRFVDEIPEESLEVSGGQVTRPGRPASLPGRGPAIREVRRIPEPDAENALIDVRPGRRVRHPLFGVGTVVRTEGSGPDCKVTVSFASVGAKRLIARYAGLEPL